eukprot:gene1073-3931_t
MAVLQNPWLSLQPMHCSDMDAVKWREDNLKSQPDKLGDALKCWQGCNMGMNQTLKEMLDGEIDMDFALEVATIWTTLQSCPHLPKGMVVWRAVKPNQTVPTHNANTRWMPVSATVDGAEAWANKHLTNGKATICKIVISDDTVRALAVGADANYEDEKEILIAPGFMINHNNIIVVIRKESYNRGNYG